MHIYILHIVLYFPHDNPLLAKSSGFVRPVQPQRAKKVQGWVSTGGTSQLRPQLGMSLAVESRALYAIWQQPLRGNRPVGAQSRTGAMPSTFPGL